MLGSQWYYSSQTTGGGASPAFLTCQEWSEDAIFSATLFFFLKESRPRAWGFFWRRQNDRETQERRRGRGGVEKEMRRVNKRVSIMFVTICLLLFAGQPSLLYAVSLPVDFLKGNRQPTWGHTAFVFFSSVFAFFVYTQTSLPKSTPQKLTQFKGAVGF